MKPYLKIFTILLATFVTFICAVGLTWFTIASQSLMQQAQERALEEHKSLEYITKQRVPDIEKDAPREPLENDLRQTLQSEYVIGSTSGAILLKSEDYSAFGPLELMSTVNYDTVWIKTYQSPTETMLVTQEYIETAFSPLVISLRYDLTNTIQTINVLYFNAVSVMIVATLGSGVIAWILARYVVKPTETLTQAMAEVRAGNLKTTVRVDEIDSDRVAAVAHQFNIMMASVNEQLSSLTDANASQQEFISYLSHEIKTPLTSILGNINRLLSQNKDPEVEATLVAIHQEAYRLKSLSVSLLKLYSQNTQVIQNVTLDTQWLSELIVSIAEPTHQALTIELEPSIFELDEGLFHIAILNVMTNAIEATMDRIIPIHVWGIDAPTHYTIHIKNRMTSTRSLTSKSENFGMGLALTEKIMKLHNGSLTTYHTETHYEVVLTIPHRGYYETV